MKTSGEQLLELAQRLGERISDPEAVLAELRRMGAEQRLEEQQKRRTA